MTELVYKVVLKHSDEGYAIWVPGLPGCASQGATEEEALANIEDAISDYLKVLAEIQNEHGTELRSVKVKVA